MAVVKMTPASWVKLLDGGPGEHADESTPGLRLKVGARGGVWNLHLRDPAGRMRKIGLGRAGTNGGGLDLVKARAAAASTRAAVGDGRDPTAEKRTAKAKAKLVAVKASAETLKQLLNHYAERDGARLRTWETQRQAIGLTFAKLLDVPVTALSKVELRDAFEKRLKVAPTAATRSRAYLSSVLSWAVKRDMLDGNPLATVKAPKGVGFGKRDRVLGDAEIGAILAALPAIAGRGNLHPLAFQVLFWTGCRLGEITGARWGEFDLDRALWTLPAERVKNAREHVLPIPGQMVAMLRERREAVRQAREKAVRAMGREPTADDRLEPEPGDLVLPSRDGGELSNWDRIGKVLVTKCGVEGWHRHDVRRSVVTGLVELGVDPLVVESVVNHISGLRGGVAGIYNRSKLIGPMKQALRLWADHLDGLEAKAKAEPAATEAAGEAAAD